MKKQILFLYLICGGLCCCAQHWTFLGFPDQQIGAVAVHPTNPNLVFVSDKGYSGFLYKSSDGGLSWDTVAYNPYNSVIFHPQNPDTMYASIGTGSYSDGLFRSADSGNTWNGFATLSLATSLVRVEFGGIFVAGTKAGGVYRSTDNGINWAQINDSLNNMNVLSLAVAYPPGIPEDPVIVYIAGTEGGIFCYPDHILLNSPEEYWHPSNMATNAVIPAISASQLYGGSSMWAASGGGSWSDGMYHSDDNGASWNLSEYWPFITDILVNPRDPNTVFAADSGRGVKRTIDGGASWQTINAGLGDSVVYCLAQCPADTMHLYAGTAHGLYVYDFSTGINETGFSKNMDITIFPNPANDKVLIITSGYKNSKIELTDIQGRVIKSFVLHASETVMPIDKLERGLYLIKIFTGENVITKKLIKQ